MDDASAKMAAYLQGQGWSGNTPTAPGFPSPSTTVMGLIQRSAAALQRLREFADGIDMLHERLVGPSPQPNAIRGDNHSPMPGTIGEMANLLHMQHATLDRIEDGLRRLHELQG